MTARKPQALAVAKGFARSIAYSRVVRFGARKYIERAGKRRLDSIEEKGYGAALRGLASEPLSGGRRYAKLTILNWQQHNGAAFLLSQDGVPVYGNTVESPQRGFPLIYRNIVVESDDLSRFTLDIPAEFRLQFSHAAFSTEQQEAYDKKYEVRQEGDFFFSLRGNLENPKYLVVTFPGFGPSTSRISYAVTYMKQLVGRDLRETAILCLQDRYGVAGTYMVTDTSGRLLGERLSEFLAKISSRLGVDEQNLLLFGASKGGSIALMAAEKFPAAAIVVAVPQLHLPYYLSKPFFANNLGLSERYRQVVQPGELLQRYCQEGRQIHHFFTNDDELSNYSQVEFLNGHNTYSRYRFAGKHGEVARIALPAMIGLIRAFIDPRERQSLGELSVREFDRPNGVSLQVRTSSFSTDVAAGNAVRFVRVSSEEGTVLQATTSTQLPMVGYLGAGELIHSSLDPAVGEAVVLEIVQDGTLRESESVSVSLGAPSARAVLVPSPALELGASGRRSYVIVDKDEVVEFCYESEFRANAAEGVCVYYGQDLADLRATSAAAKLRYRHEIFVTSREASRLVEPLCRRLAVQVNSRSLQIVVQGGWGNDELAEALRESDWPQLAVH